MAKTKRAIPFWYQGDKPWSYFNLKGSMAYRKVRKRSAKRSLKNQFRTRFQEEDASFIPRRRSNYVVLSNPRYAFSI